jgi:hypothetical protein
MRRLNELVVLSHIFNVVINEHSLKHVLECHGFNSRFRKRFTNFFFIGFEETFTKVQTFKAMDFEGYRVHYSCQTQLTVFKNIMEIFSIRCQFLNFALNGRGETNNF